MKVDLPLVKAVKARGHRYHYFRGPNGLIPLPGQPGTREFQVAYDELLRTHAPEKIAGPKRARGAGHGTLAWVITQYKTRSRAWADASPSTREVYDRRHHWLVKNYGAERIAHFDRDILRRIRDLPEFATKPSVADAIVERFGALWDYAEEFLHIDDMKQHKGVNPARNIKKLKEGDAESAPLWPLELCRKIEAHTHRDLVTFYYLARYTGQRRSDLVKMEWDHFDAARKLMFVAQQKTSARIWVPLPAPLLDYLETWSREGKYIVMSPKIADAAWEATSLTNELNRITRELGFVTTDSKGKPRYYSPHGLRHLCGVELAHAGATDAQIAAVLGHSTMKQVQVYRKQASQLLLAQGAQAARAAMYAAQEREAMIAMAGNVTKLEGRKAAG